MRICPKCRTTYSSSTVGVCYRDGEKLVSHEAFMAAESDPLRGRVFGGKYRAIERIGQGGMGMVYRAVQAGLNRQVALKILKRELTFDRDTVARFQREANALSLLTHPNTVRVYDFGQTEDGLLFLVMELLEGEVITEMLSREGPLDVLEAVRVAQQILRSLAEAHQHGIVHRDLKPDNIFIAKVPGHREPVVKVLDFGIAKIVAPDRPVDQFETQAGTVFGTPRYMSPEQAQGAALDGRSDLYTVGTLMYLMLTGRAPFVDDDAVVVMAKHIRETPESPRNAAPDRAIPKSLDDVVMRALAKEPSERYQDAALFVAALEACVPGITAAQVRSSRRKLSRLALGLAGGAALVAGGYGGYRALASPRDDGFTSSVLLRSAETPETTQGEEAPAPDDDEPVLDESPGPANVAIRSDPAGATVYRDGERLGETPMYLLVQPDQELVRVELRKPGFQPLAAELTARDGERLLKLTRAESEPSRPSKTTNLRPKRAPSTPPPSTPQETSAPSRPQETSEEGPTPAPIDKLQQGPYERFE